MGDRYKNTHMGSTGFGRTGGTITPNDAVDLPDVAKAVTVTDAGGGTLQFLPVENAGGQWLTMQGVTTGYTPPYQIRRIGTATDCTVISVADRSPGLVSLVPGLGRKINPSPNLDDASIWNLKSGWTIAEDGLSVAGASGNSVQQEGESRFAVTAGKTYRIVIDNAGTPSADKQVRYAARFTAAGNLDVTEGTGRFPADRHTLETGPTSVAHDVTAPANAERMAIVIQRIVDGLETRWTGLSIPEVL